MKNRWTSTWYLTGRKAFSGSTRGWWSGVIEATLAAILIVLGVTLLVTTVTFYFLHSVPSDFYSQLLYFVLQPLLAAAMFGIGSFLVFNALWKVGASAERRNAIAARAGDLEFLNEIRRKRGDLPTVPARASSPLQGQHLRYRIPASRRSFWGLWMAGGLCLSFVTIVAVLLVTALVKWKLGRTDWVAGMLAIPISFAALWSFYRFVRQLMKNTSVGPTVVELDRYPVAPGVKNKIYVSQAGRLRLKFLDVLLVCVEEATFNEGTNTLTDRRKVYSHRLLRKRGVALSSDAPFRQTIEFEIPQTAMHSFQSSSNRITWQIEIHGQIQGFPRVERVFEIIVIPRRDHVHLETRAAGLQTS